MNAGPVVFDISFKFQNWRAAVTRQVDADDSKAFAQRRNERSRRSSAKAQSVQKEDRALVIGHGVTMPPFTFNVSPET